MNNLKIDFLKPILRVVSSLVLLWFLTSQIHVMIHRVVFHFLKLTLRAVSPALPKFYKTSEISSINLFSAQSSSGSLYGLQLTTSTYVYSDDVDGSLSPPLLTPPAAERRVGVLRAFT